MNQPNHNPIEISFLPEELFKHEHIVSVNGYKISVLVIVSSETQFVGCVFDLFEANAN